LPERDVVRRLSSRLARDQPIDWDAVERDAATPEERDAIQHLRFLAAMAGFHRSTQAGDESMDLSASVSIAKDFIGVGERAASNEPGEPDLLPGSRWGHIEILERVGRGAFGVVYRGRDTRLEREVALKILGREGPKPAEEVLREARLLARIRHPHVVTVYGADRVDGRVGIWMEFLHGETLDRIVHERGALDAREAALIGIDLCRALSAVHAAGIVHQDVKLGNVMRAEGGRIVLMDFGLGREARPKRPGGMAGKILGTPFFMAPEVLNGGQPDARSDVYSLGVVFFALVTGTLPVDASSYSELVDKHQRGDIRRARDLRPDLPEAFAHVADRALSPDPLVRFATAGEAEQALLQSLGAAVVSRGNIHASSSKWHSKRVRVLGLAVTVCLTIAALWMFRARPATEVAARAPFSDVPSLVLDGYHEGDFFGLAAAGAGDVDQDGFGDLLVGAPFTKGGVGDVYLFRGNRNGLESQPSWTSAGKRVGACFGHSIAAFTELHPMDGFADLVIGAPGDWAGAAPTPEEFGAVYVFMGSRGGPAAEPVQVLTANLPHTLFGYAVVTGDINNDGAKDLLVGEPYFPASETRHGRVSLHTSVGGGQPPFSKQPVWTATGPPGSEFGISVALGDLNGDGYREVIVGAWMADHGPELQDAGAAYVYAGSPTGIDSIPTVLRGRHADARFGREVVFAGDLDGDGFGDLFVGAEGGSNPEESEGIAEIYFGAAKGVSIYSPIILESNVAGANFGGHASAMGDLDRDGCDDLFVGALRFQSTTASGGAAYLFQGSRRRDLRTAWFQTGGKSGSWFGGGGGSAGDVNGDGLADFWVSAPSREGQDGPNIGRVELFLNTLRP
jgi:serine/threonine-protein kinase